MVVLGELVGAGVIVEDDRGVLWGTIGGAIGRLEVGEKSIAFHPAIQHQGGHLQICDDTLYYAVGTTIYATPMEELRGRLMM